MISKDEMIKLLAASCPSFKVVYDKELEAPDESLWFDKGEVLPYIFLGEFARHMVELFKSGRTEEFADIFSVVEKLHLNGDGYVEEAAKIGLLEDIQNIAGNRGVDPEEFVQFLGPESNKMWKELNRFWGGE